jgi:hypothetical protein
MNPFKVTSKSAIHTENAVALLKDFFVKACGTDILAGTAIGTEFLGDPFKEREMAQNTKKGTQWTEVFTPVPFFKTFEEENEEEKQE